MRDVPKAQIEARGVALPTGGRATALLVMICLAGPPKPEPVI